MPILRPLAALNSTGLRLSHKCSTSAQEGLNRLLVGFWKNYPEEAGTNSA